MRLIDADALKKEFRKDIMGGLNWERIIDNAPTVELQRPTGEWEEPFESHGKTYHKCTHCHISSELILFGNFCPNCGADMREEDS